jgi:RNA polymerase sigma-70 factor (family 1)
MNTMRKYNPAEERRILEQLAQGNAFAFTLLFHHYRGRVYAVALRFLKSPELAEEIVQEVFLKVWTKRQDLLNIANFEAYLFTMARNIVFDFVKDLAREAVKKKDFNDILRDGVGADQPLIEEQYDKLLQEVVSQLPPQQKQIFRLARVEGLSHQAIAEELHISRLTVKAHMAKALRTIRQNLQHHIICLVLVPVIRILDL